jgi:hypothetical protein
MPGERAKHVYWVHLLTGFGPDARPFSVIFETQVETVAEIEVRLREHGVMAGCRLRAVDDGRGGKLIQRREEFMIGVAVLISLQPYQRPIWEPEE